MAQAAETVDGGDQCQVTGKAKGNSEIPSRQGYDSRMSLRVTAAPPISALISFMAAPGLSEIPPDCEKRRSSQFGKGEGERGRLDGHSRQR